MFDRGRRRGGQFGAGGGGGGEVGGRGRGGDVERLSRVAVGARAAVGGVGIGGGDGRVEVVKGGGREAEKVDGEDAVDRFGAEAGQRAVVRRAEFGRVRDDWEEDVCCVRASAVLWGIARRGQAGLTACDGEDAEAAMDAAVEESRALEVDVLAGQELDDDGFVRVCVCVRRLCGRALRAAEDERPVGRDDEQPALGLADEPQLQRHFQHGAASLPFPFRVALLPSEACEAAEDQSVDVNLRIPSRPGFPL